MPSAARHAFSTWSSAPSGQSITLTGANAPYYGSASVSWTLGDGSDTGSGLDTTTRTVTRETGTLSGDSCTSYAADAGSFSSPDATVSTGHCYRYTFTIKDKVGNVSSGVQAVAKVDTSGQERTAKQLVEALGHFGVDAQVVGTVTGPHVTRYEIRLAPGTKMSKVSALLSGLRMVRARTRRPSQP